MTPVEKHLLAPLWTRLRLISRSTTRLKCQSRSRRPSSSAKILWDSLGDAGSGSVGRIRLDCDGRTTTSRALRFNIVILGLSFHRARNTHPHLSLRVSPRRRIHDVVPHPRNIARLCPLSARFPSPFFTPGETSCFVDLLYHLKAAACDFCLSVKSRKVIKLHY